MLNMQDYRIVLDIHCTCTRHILYQTYTVMYIVLDTQCTREEGNCHCERMSPFLPNKAAMKISVHNSSGSVENEYWENIFCNNPLASTHTHIYNIDCPPSFEYKLGYI